MNVHAMVPPEGRNVRTGFQWAKIICDAWTKSLNSIFETGDALIGAKDQLKHGEWLEMVERELPFGASVAQRLMAIASDERLRKTDHGQFLPASYQTLYALTRLPDKVVEQSFEAGTIHPKLERNDVKFLPELPHHEPKIARREPPTPSKLVPPIEDCVLTVRRTIFNALQTMTSEEKATLLSELRAELDDFASEGAH